MWNPPREVRRLPPLTRYDCVKDGAPGEQLKAVSRGQPSHPISRPCKFALFPGAEAPGSLRNPQATTGVLVDGEVDDGRTRHLLSSGRRRGGRTGTGTSSAACGTEGRDKYQNQPQADRRPDAPSKQLSP